MSATRVAGLLCLCTVVAASVRGSEPEDFPAISAPVTSLPPEVEAEKDAKAVPTQIPPTAEFAPKPRVPSGAAPRVAPAHPSPPPPASPKPPSPTTPPPQASATHAPTGPAGEPRPGSSGAAMSGSPWAESTAMPESAVLAVPRKAYAGTGASGGRVAPAGSPRRPDGHQRMRHWFFRMPGPQPSPQGPAPDHFRPVSSPQQPS